MGEKKRSYAILGASGHIGKKLSLELLKMGHEVRLISRNAEALKDLIKIGGTPYPTRFDDPDALAKAFSGVHACFAMIPTDLFAPDFRGFQKKVGEAIAQALRETAIAFVVNLSSVGAHLKEKTGPILELHEQEKRLDALPLVNVVHLRPAYFMENNLMMLESIHSRKVAEAALRPDLRLPMIATADIAQRAAELLLRLDFKGKRTMALLGQRDLTMQEVVPVLGRAVGNPELKYVQMPEAAMLGVFKNMGVPAATGTILMEMYLGLNEGWIRPSEVRNAGNTTPTSIEGFCKELKSEL